MLFIFVCVCVQHAQRLYRHVYLTCKEESSGQDHYQALVTLLAVISVELANEEVVVDLIRLVLALQVRSASINMIRTLIVMSILFVLIVPLCRLAV